MSNTEEPRKTKVVVIREELVALTGHWLDAVILNQLIYWSQKTRDYDEFLEEERTRDPSKDIELTHGWIFKSADELGDELMVGVSSTTILRHINNLTEAGYLDKRRNPRCKWDRTWQYRPNIIRVQNDLMAIGYVLSGYTLVKNAFCKMQDGTAEMNGRNSTKANRNQHSERAIPETTLETTSENTAEKKQPAPTGEKEAEAAETVANILNPVGESAGEKKKRELQEKLGTDPVAHMVEAANGEPGKRKTRPRGWEDATDDEWRIIQRVADLWAMGKLPRKDAERHIIGAGDILDLYGDDARAAIAALDKYYTDEYDNGFTVAGPASLVTSMTAYRANGGKNGNGNGQHPTDRRASYTVRDGVRTLVVR